MRNQIDRIHRWLGVAGLGGAVAGLLLLASAPARASSTVVVYQENFESYSTGTTPTGWQVRDAANTYAIITGSQTANDNVWVQNAPDPQSFNDTKALHYVGNTASVAPFGWIDPPLATATLKTAPTTFSFDFNLQPGSGAVPTTLKLAATNQNGVYVTFAAAGTSVLIYDPAHIGNSPTSLSISPNTWYRATLTMNPHVIDPTDTPGHAQVILSLTDAGGSPVGTPLSWWYDLPHMDTGFDRVIIREDSAALGVSNFYDNFLLTETIPEPGVGLLLGLGAAVLWLRRRGERRAA